MRNFVRFVLIVTVLVGAYGCSAQSSELKPAAQTGQDSFDDQIQANVTAMAKDGERIFRFDTFGDEVFWGDTLKLHRAIIGEKLGGVGAGVSPKTALSVGLKVDSGALPASLVEQIKQGKVDIDDPATTVALLKLNAVVGVTAFLDDKGGVRSMGIQCALCHSVVDDSFAPGIGRRRDGWANRDLNVGAIIALAPDLSAVTELLGVDEVTVRKVLAGWGPGKFDAALFLDGKGFRPDGKTSATLIPAAFGLAGVNLHTFTGWGSVTHWNAFVANLEMHGQGTFLDSRLDDATRFPVAARAHSGNTRSSPDLITSKLAALHFYQLAIPAPKAPPNPAQITTDERLRMQARLGAAIDERLRMQARLGAAIKDNDAALAGTREKPSATSVQRGESVFNTQGTCASCHVPPIFTEPGWNMHSASEIGIDDFQANRGPDMKYRTTPLKGLWTHQKGGFYHDGRFASLRDVVDHYDNFLKLSLSEAEKTDLVDYLLSL
jgi:hypothetical protein